MRPTLVLIIVALGCLSPSAVSADGSDSVPGRGPETRGAVQQLERLPDSEAAKYAVFDCGKVFVKPAGPKGLVYTAETKGLEGRKVRVTGYMVRGETPDPERFMLSMVPMRADQEEYGMDDVQPDVIHVFVKPKPGEGSAWQPYLFTVYGVLELGPKLEADGRLSWVRIRAEHVTVGKERVVFDVCRPMPERDDNLAPHDQHSGDTPEHHEH